MIYLATPIWRYLDVRTAHSIAAAVAMVAPDETVWWETIDGDALISRTRSQLGTKFLNEPRLQDADVMVIIDDDVQFDPDDVWKIVAGAREHKTLYGGIYVTRSTSPHPAALITPGTHMEFEKAKEPKPIEIRYLATGFMAIPREVLEKMVHHDGFLGVNGEKHRLEYCSIGVGKTAMWDFFRTFNIREADGRVHYLSEDWAFCERARQLGYKVFADQSIILGHRAVVTTTVADLSEPGHALSEKGAASKGSSILITQGAEGGSDTDDMLSMTDFQKTGTDVATTVLVDAIAALTGVEPGKDAWHTWAGCGTALGLVRAGRLIPWDHDIDILVEPVCRVDPDGKLESFIDYEAAAFTIQSYLAAAGFQLTRRLGTPDDGYVLSFQKDKVPVDVFFMYHDPTTTQIFHKVYGPQVMKYVYPDEFFDGVAMRNLGEGIQIPCPRDFYGYVKATYGDDWKEPREDWDWSKHPPCLAPA